MPIDAVQLGRTGLKVSELALGTWRFDRQRSSGEVETDYDTAHDLLDRYAGLDGFFIDTADSYGDGEAEVWIGDWLDGRDRDDFVIASKIYWPTRPGPNGRGLNRKHLRRQLETTLDRLGTDYLGVLYTHRWDDDTPVDEFMRTLTRFVDEGRVHYLGTSTDEPNAWKVTKANERAERRGYEPFTVSQPPYNLISREIEGNYIDMCRDYGIAVVSWSPLAQGFLTGKYERGSPEPAGSRGAADDRFANRYLNDEQFDALDVVREVAEETGATPAQASLAWLLHHDDVTAPIVGARTLDQLEENVGACDVTLSARQFERLTQAWS